MRSYDYLKCHEQALKSSYVTYAQMMKKRNKVFIKDNMMKDRIGRLSDKMYIFSNGITTLPHGHSLLKPIYDECRGKIIEFLQTDNHIMRILAMEKEIEQKHEKLKYMGLFFTQNEYIFI